MPIDSPTPADPAPTTVTDAVAYLRGAGYTDDVELEGTSVQCARTNMSYALDNVIVDHTFRFEGDSDPGDEAIVLGLRYPDTDVKATLVSAFGPGADPATAEFFSRLRLS
ncbi:MAG: hypothetical protein JWL72_3694 [Ilumatobacteraceae bacterium]|nr:hypothetical protein [Ilumatobacteraceae bacterium]